MRPDAPHRGSESASDLKSLHRSTEKERQQTGSGVGSPPGMLDKNRGTPILRSVSIAEAFARLCRAREAQGGPHAILSRTG